MRTNLLEVLVIKLSLVFMNLPWTRDCMAMAWNEGRRAATTENPYLR